MMLSRGGLETDQYECGYPVTTPKDVEARIKREKEKYQVRVRLIRWEGGDVSLVTEVKKVGSGEVIGEKDEDVLIYEKKGRMCHYVFAEPIGPEDDEEEKELEV
jgi:hypothetical protein